MRVCSSRAGCVVYTAAALSRAWHDHWISGVGLRVYGCFRFSEDVGLNRSAESAVACHNLSDDEEAKHKRVESLASTWSYYCSVAAFVPAIPLALLMGRWSDKYGRRPVLMAGIFGSLLNYLGLLLYLELKLPLYTVVLSCECAQSCFCFIMCTGHDMYRIAKVQSMSTVAVHLPKSESQRRRLTLNTPASHQRQMLMGMYY